MMGVLGLSSPGLRAEDLGAYLVAETLNREKPRKPAPDFRMPGANSLLRMTMHGRLRYSNRVYLAARPAGQSP